MTFPHRHLSRHIRPFTALAAVVACFAISLPLGAQQPTHEYMPGLKWPQPPVIDPGPPGGPPSDATVLFDGKDLSAWENGENWKVEDGVAIVGKGYITTKEIFGDCQLHVEWSAPEPAGEQSQQRGNSGIFLAGIYEIQVLDSYENETYFDGQAGAIYKQTPPMVNAMRPPGQWNVYDILWTAPRFNTDGTLKSPAYITAIHNGVMILNHFELVGETPYDQPHRYTKHPEKMPISIQDHGNPVRFRNIWVRDLAPIVPERVRPPYMKDLKTGEETPVE
jgi:hypothetical protein